MTNIVPSLSALALRHLIEGVSHALGFVVVQEGLESAVGFLTGHFRDHSQRLTLALTAANERAWRALELSLAGESWWERVRRVLASSEQRAFREQVRTFLQATPLAEHGPEFRRQCLQDLRRARKTGHLTGGALDPAALAREAGAFARFAEPKALLDAEWQAVEQVADELRRADFVALSRLLAARPDAGASREAPSLLVVAVRYFFRRAVETDRELFQGLAFARMEGLSQAQEVGFSGLSEALTHHGQRLEELLGELSETVAQTHEAVLDMQVEQQRQGEHVQEIYEGVRKLLEQHLLLRRDLHAHDSLSIRNDSERQLVKSLKSRYRALAPEQKQKLPALLNGLAKLEVVAGEFEAAQGDFREVAALVASDPEAKAQAHHNAYRTALERRDWRAALDELLRAVALDAPRFAPFPVEKYQPQRILGAGGFGVAFRAGIATPASRSWSKRSSPTTSTATSPRCSPRPASWRSWSTQPLSVCATATSSTPSAKLGPISSWITSRARRSRTTSRSTVRFPPPIGWRWRGRWRTGCRRHTPRASCIATSSRPIFWSAANRGRPATSRPAGASS
jgi:hypothetical protein